MIKNPTVQVQSLPKSQRMDMVIESIKETHTFERKGWKEDQKVEQGGLDKDKFNVLMKRSMWEMKRKDGKGHTRKKDPLDELNMDKQLDEIEILIDIIKKTGNVPQRENYKPMVHVPLPREFYELKPLVPFRSSARKHQKRPESSRSKGHRETLPKQRSSAYLEVQESSDLSKKVQHKPISRKLPDTYYQEKSYSENKKVPTYEKATLTSSEGKPRFDKATLTTSRNTSIGEEVFLEVKNEYLKLKELECEVPKEVVKHKDSAPRDKKILREMSTISSYSVSPEAPISYSSIEVSSNQQGFYEVVDANDLYVAENSWTILDPVDDPLKNSKQVIVKPVVKIKVESESDLLNSKDLKKQDNDYKNEDNVANDVDLKHSDKDPNPVPNVTESKSQVSSTSAKKAKETSISRKVSYSDEPPELDLTPAHNYMRRQAREIRLNVDRQYIDNELQEEFNNMESSLFSGLVTRETTSDYTAKESSTSVPLEQPDQNDHPIPEENQRKQTKERTRSRDKVRSRPKSQKRSKKNLPELHLSDYKGFYVVHTTNDWTFS